MRFYFIIWVNYFEFYRFKVNIYSLQYLHCIMYYLEGGSRNNLTIVNRLIFNRILRKKGYSIKL